MDLAYDPFSDAAMADPLPIYAELRRRGRASWLPAYDMWALPRFEDVWQALSLREEHSITEGPVFPRETVSGPWRGTDPVGGRPLPSFVSLDPPIHSELRAAVGRSLRPRSVAELEAFVRDQARTRLDVLCERGRFDATSEYGGLVSAATMCHMMGLPLQDAHVVLDLVNRALRRSPGSPGLTEDGIAARVALTQRIEDLVARRRSLGAPDPLSPVDRLVRAEIGGRRLDDAEIAVQVTSLATGGTETVPKVVAGGLLELWRHPDQRRSVAANPACCRRAFEEMVRFGGPLQWVGRTLLVDMELAGERMRSGQRLLLLLASANRDEREFTDPDTFRWDRDLPRHLGFGYGQHFCVGTHLARLEGRILLEELLARVPEYDVDLAGVVRSPSDFQVGYTSLPLVVG